MNDAPHGFLGGRIVLRQGAGGHRAGTDAVLLAAAVEPAQTGLVVDAGAGAGAVGLMAAARAPRAVVRLVEIDPESAQLARDNIALNGLEERVEAIEADLLSYPARLSAGLANETADVVLTNPPFLAAGRARVSPDARRALAHVAAAPLAEWTRACLSLLAPGGVFVMIHRADALAECLAAVDGRLGALCVLPVLPRAGEAATRLLLRGVKGSRAPLTLCAPLILHESDGAFMPAAAALHAGAAGLDW